MASKLFSDKQRALFQAIAKSGTLIFATGPKGIEANIVGTFAVSDCGNEDRLEMGDGTNHVHIDWKRVKSVELASYGSEEMLTFKDGKEVLFYLYKISGAFSKEIKAMLGELI